jgi:hypothetical protein
MNGRITSTDDYKTRKTLITTRQERNNENAIDKDDVKLRIYKKRQTTCSYTRVYIC